MVVRDASVDLITLAGKDPMLHALGVALPRTVAGVMLHIRLPSPSDARSMVFDPPPPGGVDEDNPLVVFWLAGRCAALCFVSLFLFLVLPSMSSAYSCVLT